MFPEASYRAQSQHLRKTESRKVSPKNLAPSGFDEASPGGGQRAWKSSWPFQFVLAVLSVLWVSRSVTAAEPIFREHEVKAVYLFKFGLFTDWPPDRFAKPDAPLLIGVIGNDLVAAELDKIARTNTIKGHKLVIRQLNAKDDARACHILFIGAGNDFWPILAKLKAASVLTVGEHEKFAERGGMINFISDQDTLKFQVNNGAATRSGLEISSKLLDVVQRWRLIVNSETPKGNW